MPDCRKIPERDILLETRKGVALSYAPAQISIINLEIKKCGVSSADLFRSFNDTPYGVFVKRKCEQKGPKKVSSFSTRFHVVSNVFPKYQMLTF